MHAEGLSACSPYNLTNERGDEDCFKTQHLQSCKLVVSVASNSTSQKVVQQSVPLLILSVSDPF